MHGITINYTFFLISFTVITITEKIIYSNMFLNLSLQEHFTSYTYFTAFKTTLFYFFNQLTEINDSQKWVRFRLILAFLVFPMWFFFQISVLYILYMQQDVWARLHGSSEYISTCGLYGSKRVVYAKLAPHTKKHTHTPRITFPHLITSWVASVIPAMFKVWPNRWLQSATSGPLKLN